MPTITQTEPVAVGGAVIAFVTAALALAQAFGVNLSPDQTAAILGFIVALIGVVTILVRKKVTPV